MARNKKCLKCKFCKPIRGNYTAKNWRDCWYCDYLFMKGKRGNKGDDPNKCLLFEARKKERRVIR